MREGTRPVDWLVFAVLAFVAVGLAVRAGNSDFTYSDASRHAMDGVFVLDAAAERPFDAPFEWATSYYAKSPALGFGRYPPLLPVMQAPFYAVMGVCPFAARLAGALVWLAGLVFFYETARRELGRAAAAFAAGVMLAGPGAVRWGGEVMLELPAIAFLSAAAYLFLRYRETGRRALLTWSIVVVCLAGWVKQPAVLSLAVIAPAVLVHKRGLRSALRELWPGIVVSVLLVAPLAALSLRFGRANVMLLSGVGAQYEFAHMGNWLFYLTQIPLYYIGWAPLIFVLVGIAGAICGKRRGIAGLWALWAAVFYLFFTLVGYKSARLAMFLIPALAWFAGAGFKRLSDGVSAFGRTAVAMAGAAAVAVTFCAAVLRLPGADFEVAQAASKALAAEPGRILYGGYRNGTFIFRIRELAGRDRPTVVRTSKMFYVPVIQSELGGDYRPWTAEEMREKMAVISPDILVLETEDSEGGYYVTSADAMLLTYAKTGDFEYLDSVWGRDPARPVIEIYRYVGPRRPGALEVPLPGVGFSVELPSPEL